MARLDSIQNFSFGDFSRCKTYLPAAPHETTWFKLVEEKFSSIQEPVYRHVVVETLVVIGTILERDSSLEFDLRVDVDDVIKTAAALHAKVWCNAVLPAEGISNKVLK